MKGLNKLKSKLKNVLKSKAEKQPAESQGYTPSAPRILKTRTSKPIMKSKTQFILGLDFGTSFTKVSISSFEDKYAVPLHEQQHIIATKFYSLANGECTLDKSKSVNEHIVQKVRLIEKRARTRDLATMAAYCALVLKQTREWVSNYHAQRLSQYDVDWLLNVGLPTESSQNNHLASDYKKIIHAAWRFSFIEQGFSLEEVQSYLDYNEQPQGIDSSQFLELDSDCLSLFPEFVAQIQSYIRSPQRQKFGHLLIDVGGGTVDMAVFRVVEEDGDFTYPIYAKSVRTIGAEVLEKERERVGNNEADKEIRKAFKKQIADMLTRIPAGGYMQDIHCIFIGGGSNIPLYQKALDEYKVLQQRHYPLRITGLTQPNELINTKLKKNDFHRVSVAYGLTFEPDDLGQLERGKVAKKTTYKKRDNDYLLDAS
ncbi:hypothetical protein BCU83_16325 [Vibrio breoganii]|uniref:hypothetical protein n=1 Tax=Vibrio breoganii TaxID=553239 RepID=UPI000C820F91|nr:hypothetical protein [Vibrio breoganii]PMG76626.1 hypothetical protein BCU83_16325 [Vibrio breoganii]